MAADDAPHQMPDDAPHQAPVAGRWDGARGVAICALLAFLAQLAIAQLAILGSPFAKYPLAARQWLAGELPGERLADLSPLYFELNVALLRLGVEPADLLPPVQMAAAALAVGLIAGRLRRRGLSLWLVGLAAAAMTLDHQLLIYARILEPEALLLLAVCAWLAALDGEPGRPRLALAGTLGALGVLLRPTLLPIHWLVIPVFLALRRSGWATQRRRALASWAGDLALYLVPLVLASLWSAARLADAVGDAASPSMSPGTVFYEGNHPVSNGTSAVYPPMVRLLLAHSEARNAAGGPVPDSGHVLYRQIARQELGDAHAPIGAVNRFWAKRAIAFLGDNPLAAWRLLSAKLRYSLHLFTWHDVPSAGDLALRLATPALPFSVLGALALVFLVFHAHAWREYLLDLALFAAQLGVMLVFYVSGRQRLILLPVLIFFATLGVWSWRELNGRRRALAAALAALLALVLSFPDAAQRDQLYRDRLGLRAAAARAALQQSLGDRFFIEAPDQVIDLVAWSAAEYEDLRPAEFPQALLLERASARLAEKLPSFTSSEEGPAAFDLASLELVAGRLEVAEKRLQNLTDDGVRVFRGGKAPSDPRILLARAQALLGKKDQARATLEDLLAVTPGDPFALAELQVLSGDPAPAAAIERYYSAADADWLIGRAALAHHQPELAYQHLARLHARFPSARRVLLELAAACADLGRDSEGVGYLIESLRLAPVPVADAAKVVPMIRRWADQNPALAFQLQALSLLDQHGAFPEAAVLLERIPPTALDTPFGRRARDLISKAKTPDG